MLLCTVQHKITITRQAVREKYDYPKNISTIIKLRLLSIPGGELIAVTLTVDDEGQYLGNCKTIKQNMFEMFTVLWKEMLQEGRITQVKTIFPTRQTVVY